MTKLSDVNASDISAKAKDELAEAILKKKDSINKLIVDDSTNDDNSICSMSTQTMEQLQLFRGYST